MNEPALVCSECKKALAAAGGDIEVAIEELRKSSGMKAAKKAAEQPPMVLWQFVLLRMANQVSLVK